MKDAPLSLITNGPVIERAGSEWPERLGVPLSELEGLTTADWILRFVHPDDWPEGFSETAKLHAGKPAALMEHTNRIRNGEGWATIKWTINSTGHRAFCDAEDVTDG